MHSRRKCLWTATYALVGAAGISRSLIAAPARDGGEDGMLRALYEKSSYVFVAEVVGTDLDEIADGDVRSHRYESRTINVVESLKGAKPAKPVEVGIGWVGEHHGVDTGKGKKLVLFLNEYGGAGVLGEKSKPYVTTDMWFGALPYSDALAKALKNFSEA
jgi:hypothetical protein